MRYDVIFLKGPMTAKDAIAHVPTNDGVDSAIPGSGVIYVTRLVRLASRSKLARLAQLPIYQFMTIRNWNTTTKLLAMMR